MKCDIVLDTDEGPEQKNECDKYYAIRQSMWQNLSLNKKGKL